MNKFITSLKSKLTIPTAIKEWWGSLKLKTVYTIKQAGAFLAKDWKNFKARVKSSILGFMWFKITAPIRRFISRWRMWGVGPTIFSSRYSDAWYGFDDLQLLLVLVPTDPTPQNREILYQAIMNSGYVTYWFKLKYWFSNKIVYRFLIWSHGAIPGVKR